MKVGYSVGVFMKCVERLAHVLEHCFQGHR